MAVSQVSTENATFEYLLYFLEHCDSMYKLTRVSFFSNSWFITNLVFRKLW